MQKRPKKLDVLLYGYVYVFLYILTPKNTVYRLHTLCIRARALYGLKMCKYRALNVSFLGLLTYLHMFTFQHVFCYVEAIKLRGLPFILRLY